MEKKLFMAPKIISDPIWGRFDIRSVLPMVDAPQFQKLDSKLQLGMNYLTYPSANHTRKAHSLGAYAAMVLQSQYWLDLGLITRDEARALQGFALYHDIGHPPFSHVTEALCNLDNSGLGLRMINELKDNIEACGIDFGLFKDLFSHKNPLYLAVSDKNLGMEKIDYLRRDGHLTGVGEPDSVDYLRWHVYFVNGQMMIDKKAIGSAKRLQQFYMTMYKDVYLHKRSIIAQRVVQQMVYGLMRAEELTAESLPNLTDYDLRHMFSVSKNSFVRYLYDLFLNRVIFAEAIVICYEKYLSSYRTGEKPIRVFGVHEDSGVINRFIGSINFSPKRPDRLMETEAAIAEIAGIPPSDILVVPVTSPERFEATDVKIYNNDKTLKDIYPRHFEDMADLGQAHATLKVCTLEKYREKLSKEKIAREVYDYLLTRI